MSELELLKTINRKLDALLKDKKPKETLVNAKVVTGLMNIDNATLRRYRENNVIGVVRDGKKVNYVLESIPEILINKKAS